jgi:hypothetical protein
MLIVLEVASGPPWRAGIWALAPALTLSMGSASSGGRWFRRGRRDQGGEHGHYLRRAFPWQGKPKQVPHRDAPHRTAVTAPRSMIAVAVESALLPRCSWGKADIE